MRFRMLRNHVSTPKDMCRSFREEEKLCSTPKVMTRIFCEREKSCLTPTNSRKNMISVGVRTKKSCIQKYVL